jgi:hypothetical protein
MKLTGTLGFSREGRRFTMKLAVDSTISGLGTTAEIAPPSDDEVVATPERRREVDDRDYLLQGIAPPLRRNPDGTAVPPAPVTNPSTTKPGSDDPTTRSARPRPAATPGATR